jgi:pimeloyl-ACP methyl ester carboxylesterase
MDLVDLTVRAPDGRMLAVQQGGCLTGVAVLVHNGTPNSRLLYPPHVELADRQRIRLVSYDRPGYGGSTRLAGRTVADCVHDVRAIAAAFDLERIAVVGHSGGGPHALACAALLGDLVVAVAVLACEAPRDASDLDLYAGMGEHNADSAQLLERDPVAARAELELQRQQILTASADDAAELLATLLSPVDTVALTRQFVEFGVATAHDGLAPGADGWWDDSVALAGDWGFRLDSITTPVLLRHGRQDRFVPVAHGEWLARHIPGVEAHLTEDDGHLTITQRHLESVHGWLLDRFRRSHARPVSTTS